MKILSLMPHMHLRGKDDTIDLVSPEGKSERLLSVPSSFSWQTMYYLKEPRLAAMGSRLTVVAHYDNSANNPHNPNPNETVRWGEQSFHEMLGEIPDVAIPVNTNVRTVVAYQEKKPAGWTKQVKVD